MARKTSKIPTSKLVVWYFIVLSTLFLLYCCWEMHRLCDLSPMAYIAPTVMGFMASVLGVYVYRAKKTDEFILALKKAEIEKFEGIKISSLENNNQEEINYNDGDNNYSQNSLHFNPRRSASCAWICRTICSY